MDSLMPRRPLGATGIHVSPIGLGTVKLGRNQGVKYPRPFDLPTDEEALRLLARAADLGINLIDTAPAYGVSEARLGRLLTQANWFGARSRWILSTKAGEEFEEGASHFDFSASAIRTSVHRSLQRLRTDYLDLVLLHSNGDDTAIISDHLALAELLSLKQAGKVRAIGISTKTLDGGLLALGANDATSTTTSPHALHNWCDVLMVSLNQSDTTQLPLIHEAGKRGVGVLIKKALDSGHAALASNTSPIRTHERISLSNPASCADPIHHSLQFVLTQGGPAISSIIAGTINPDHLAANVAAVLGLPSL